VEAVSLFKELKRRNVFRVGIAYAVATWLLIQVTDTVFPRIGLPDSAVTLVIALLAIGFIPALIFAWAFEMTPDGLKREKDIDRSQSITPTTGRKLDRMIIGILTVAVAYLLLDKLVLSAPQTPSQAPAAQVSGTKDNNGDSSPDVAGEGGPSIAVLPFVNMSADKDNEYFSDGITEELLNVLVKVSSLHVASRTSAFAYKGKDLPVSQIARELRVGNIVEGSVRKAGNRVRITAQLIDAESDRHIWSETYERELDDIFEIQEEISSSIVDALKVALNVDEAAALEHAQRPTENTEAYELYLQGRFAWRQRKEENIRKSIELFEKALELDPDFARAHEGLASAWGVLPAWSDMSAKEAAANAKPHAVRALELDPTLSEARGIMAEVALEEHRWADAIEQYRQAITDAPRDPTLHQWLGEAFMSMGYLSGALTELRLAYDLDPASPVINQSIVWIASANHEDDLAMKHIGISTSLGMGEKAMRVGFDALLREQKLDGLLAGDQLVDQGPQFELARTYMKMQTDPSLAKPLAAQLDEVMANTDAEDLLRTTIYSLVDTGQAERAAQLWVKQVLQNDWVRLGLFWGSSNEAGKLRQTTAFRQALADLSLLDYFRQAGWPDLCRPLGENDFECDP
jgi:TolB-like protein